MTGADPIVIETVRQPATIEQAVTWLHELGPSGAALAGGTWVMRAGLRGESRPATHVALHLLPELHGIAGVDPVVVGALVTHTELAAWDAPSALAALRQAAAFSAFPQIRNMATVGGNIASRGFAEADLVPALLALGATVHLADRDGRSEVDLGDFLAGRANRPYGEIIVGVSLVAPATVRSGFARLTVRRGGEYAIASVALAVETDPAGVVREARVAVGSVEHIARRCPVAESALVGDPLVAAAARAAGAAAAAECTPRDGLDAQGWYRTAVLPSLFALAAARITNPTDSTQEV